MPWCLVFSHSRQMLILRGMSSLMSFLCLSPSYRRHIPSLHLLPPPSCFHLDRPPWDGNYNSVDTLTPQGPLPAFSVVQHLSLCLSLSTPLCFLSFILTQHFSTHGCLFPFCLSPTVPLALLTLLLHLLSSPCYFFIFVFNFPFPALTFCCCRLPLVSPTALPV